MPRVRGFDERVRVAAVLPAVAAFGLASTPTVAAELVPESQVIDALGDCVVRAEPGITARLMEAPAGSARERDLLVAVSQRATNCMRVTQLRMPRWVFRGTIAGARLRAVQGELTRARSLPPLHPGRVENSPDNGVLARRFAACVVAEGPAGASDLVREPLGTPGSRDAAAALRPAMSACIPEQVELHIGAPELRVNLADALYERLHGAPSPAPTEERTD